jgi:ABC-type transport system substrate-binding protein
MPMMGVFNNLVLYDQNKPQNSDAAIVPELATSWTWNPDHTAIMFRLRDGVKWHDGKPFTSADVKCTFDLLINHGKAAFTVTRGMRIAQMLVMPVPRVAWIEVAELPSTERGAATSAD